MSKCLDGELLVLGELTIEWIWVEPGASWLNGRGGDVPSDLALNSCTWFLVLFGDLGGSMSTL
jgi:hypothetical protein